MARLYNTLKPWAFIGVLLGFSFLLGLELRTLADRHGLWPGSGTSPSVLPPAVTSNVERPPSSDPRGYISADEEELRQPMDFTLQSGGVLQATGSIDAGTAARLARKLDMHGEEVSAISLNSPGGTLDEAIAMARMVREYRLSAMVENGAICASSCPLVLAGGPRRSVGAKAAIGLHQFYTPSGTAANAAQAAADAQVTAARITRHLKRMGVDPALWLHALETPPRSLYYLTAPEMRKYRLVTGSEMLARY